MDDKEINISRGSKLTKMKVTYFLSVMGIYFLTFIILYGISAVLLTIFPVHPYITLAVNLLLMAGSISITKYIVDIELKDHWLRH